jgi:hypothetical protein
MGTLPPVFVELRANIGEFTAKMGEAKTEIATLEKESASSFAKFKAVGKIAFEAVGVAAVAVGVMAVEMADKFEASHAKLETALKNAGSSYEEYKGQIEATSKSQEKYGYNSAQTEAALATLTTSLQDPKKALDDLSIATDLAKFKGVDLQEASIAVAKAQEGNMKPLKALGIDLPIVASSAAKLATANDKLTAAQEALQAVQADPSSSHAKLVQAQNKVADAQKKVNDLSSAGTDIIKSLSDRVGGQASAASETLGGKIESLKAGMEDLLIKIGLHLTPILLKMIDGLQQAGSWMSKHKDVVLLVAAAIAGPLVAAMIAWAASMIPVVAAMALAAATAIIAAAPFIAIGIAVMGVILALKYVHDHMNEIMSKIKAKFQEFKDAVAAIFDGIKDKFASIWSGMGDAVKKAFSVVGDIVKGFFNIYIGFFNHVIDQLDKIQVKLPSALGGGSFGVDIKHIPLLAQGGIVSSPTLAMIGERGPEAVVPLSKMAGMGSGLVVNITVQGSVVQERDLAITVRDNIAQMMRRRGLNPNILGV